jgi:hypothetical protein
MVLKPERRRGRQETKHSGWSTATAAFCLFCLYRAQEQKFAFTKGGNSRPLKMSAEWPRLLLGVAWRALLKNISRPINSNFLAGALRAASALNKLCNTREDAREII